MIRHLALFTMCVSVGASLGMTGCGGSTPPKLSTTPVSTNRAGNGHAEAGHPTEGPHHGHLIELGKDAYHVELTHDDATKSVTAYLLDGEARKPVSIVDEGIVLNLIVDGRPLQAMLVAMPQEGDTVGEASRFSVQDQAVLKALEAPKTTGRVNVTIKGKSYSGTVEHHEHEGHQH